MTERTTAETAPAEACDSSEFDVHRRGVLAISTAAALGASVGTGIATAAAQDEEGDQEVGLFHAALTGDQHPEPVDTDAIGGAVVSVSEDRSELEYALLVSNIEDVTQAHIHLGSEGENGPVAAWLYPAADATEPELQEGRFDGILATGTITEENLTEEVEDQSMDAFLEEIVDENGYVNVHTEANPGGEIRGQLLSVAATVEMLMDQEDGDGMGEGGEGDDGMDNESGSDNESDGDGGS